MRGTLFTYSIVLLALAVILPPLFIPHIPVVHVSYGALKKPFEPSSMLFGGDVLLARDVERKMDLYGGSYPFEGIRNILAAYDYSLVNFESAIPKVHEPTLNESLTFSAARTTLDRAYEAGIDGISLANNHTDDYGDDGYAHTRATCSTHSVDCAGHPTKLASSSVMYLPLGDVRVSILMLHTLNGAPASTTLQTLIDEMEIASDVQFVFVHWGAEYVASPSDAQRALAHSLIDAGIDGIIGHHSHVTGAVEVYRNRLIAYSLGNLVFDQYFEDAVQKGLLLGLDITEDSLVYTLIGISSIETPAQPHLMSVDSARRHIDSIQRINAPLGKRITLPR